VTQHLTEDEKKKLSEIVAELRTLRTTNDPR